MHTKNSRQQNQHSCFVSFQTSESRHGRLLTIDVTKLNRGDTNINRHRIHNAKHSSVDGRSRTRECDIPVSVERRMCSRLRQRRRRPNAHQGPCLFPLHRWYSMSRSLSWCGPSISRETGKPIENHTVLDMESRQRREVERERERHRQTDRPT